MGRKAQSIAHLYAGCHRLAAPDFYRWRKIKMKLISISNTLLSKYYKIDREVLQKTNRPVVLIVRLKYKGRNHEFAVPLRSNIPPSVPSDQYFALPNRPSTKPRHHHGLHYIKMYPVEKRFYVRYRTEGNVAAKLCLAFIDKNESKIVQGCQDYLIRYENGNHPPFSTNLDLLIQELDRLCSK